MGLEQFDVAPDNKGGRKKEEEVESDEPDTAEGKPYVPSMADENWWLGVMNESIEQQTLPEGDFEEFTRLVRELADYIHLQPVNALHALDESEVVDIDWSWIESESPDDWMDARWPGAEPVTGGSTSRFGSSSGQDAGEGLSSIINAAK